VDKRLEATRNRQRLLESAKEVIARRGVDVKMSDLAQEAGLGVATVYRNFADKAGLIHALVEIGLADLVESLHSPPRGDAGFAFVAVWTEILQAMIANRALADYLADRISGLPTLDDLRRQLYEVFETELLAAQESGFIRPDVTVIDLRLATMALGRLLPSRVVSGEVELLVRLQGVMLDGLRTAVPMALLPIQTTRDHLTRALDQPQEGQSEPFRRGRRSWEREG
jgi:AcrR family transcriptional regulator